MNPDDFLDVAKALADSDSPGAAACRSAISRAYYFAFHVLRTMIEHELKVKLMVSAGGNEHKLMQDYLLNCNVNEVENIGQQLANLHVDRKRADYDLSNVKVQTLANSRLCIARAESLIAEARSCFTGQLKPKLIAGMTQYKKIRESQVT